MEGESESTKSATPMFYRLISANPAFTTVQINADVVQSVVKRSEETHEFCKLFHPSIAMDKLKSQTDRLAPYHKTVSHFIALSVSS